MFPNATHLRGSQTRHHAARLISLGRRDGYFSAMFLIHSIDTLSLLLYTKALGASGVTGAAECRVNCVQHHGPILGGGPEGGLGERSAGLFYQDTLDLAQLNPMAIDLHLIVHPSRQCCLIIR